MNKKVFEICNSQLHAVFAFLLILYQKICIVFWGKNMTWKTIFTAHCFLQLFLSFIFGFEGKTIRYQLSRLKCAQIWSMKIVMLFSKVASTYAEVGLQFVSKSEILRSHVTPLPQEYYLVPKQDQHYVLRIS